MKPKPQTPSLIGFKRGRQMTAQLTHETGTFDEGDCYYAAFVTFKNEFSDGLNLKPTKWLLVRGIFHDARGAWGHAWLEDGDTVYDPMQRGFFPKLDYYAINHVSRTVHYNVKTALDHSLRSGHFGAWDEQIAATKHLPRDRKRNAREGGTRKSGVKVG
jgi:hypothetical protein